MGLVTVFPMNLPFKSPKRQINIRFFSTMPSIKKWRWAKKLPYGDGLSTDVSVPRTYGDEIDDLHFAIVCGT
jgi:hypothetical protein